MGLTSLAKVMPDMAALSAIDLSSNKCFGDKEGRDQYGNKIRVHDNDKNQTGWTTFFEALEGNKTVQTLVLSDIGIGPVGLTTISKTISDMAGLKEVNLSTNFGICETVSVRDGAATGIQISSGVCATVDGRWGQVQADPDEEDNEVKLMWLDDCTFSEWTKETELASAVAAADVVMSNATIDALRKSHLNVTLVCTA